jgi:hypothetical protein
MMHVPSQGSDNSGDAREDGTSAIADLVELWSTAARAFMNGDLRTYAELARHTADYRLYATKRGWRPLIRGVKGVCQSTPQSRSSRSL